MTKRSKIAKAKGRQAMIVKYAPIRQALKEAGDYEGLSKLPKDTHPSRLKLRDQADGRPRGYIHKFGMSRIRFRKLVYQGLIPGIKKASWRLIISVEATGEDNRIWADLAAPFIFHTQLKSRVGGRHYAPDHYVSLH